MMMQDKIHLADDSLSNRTLFLRRRALLAAAIGGVLTLDAGPSEADEPSGFDPLNQPSILVRSPETVLLTAISLAGARLVAVGEHGVIIYSDDNGESWTQGQVPVNVTLTCVGFATPMVGWAAGHFGVVLGTVDGGKTWGLQLNGNQENQLALLAAQDSAVATNPSPAAPIALRRANHFLALGPSNPFLTVLPIGARNIMAFGAYRIAAASDDGGKNWADWSLHIFEKYSYNIYGGLAVGSNLYLVGEFGLVFGSTDGGNTFLPLGPTSSVTLFGILAPRDGSLVVFGVAGTCMRSADGGKTWRAAAIASQDDISSGRVLRSGVIVLVTEAGALFKSTDSGVTFAAVSGVTPQLFTDIEEAANGHLVAVGAAGVTAISEIIS